MKNIDIIIGYFSLGILLYACQQPSQDFVQDLKNPDRVHQVMKKLSDVIVHDIFSPPVASRIYAYPSIAAYEAALPAYPGFRSLAGQLNQLKATPIPSADKEYNFELASVHAFLRVSQALVFSEEKISDFREQLYEEMKQKGVPRIVFKNSIEYGEQVAQHILKWADQDNYKQTRTFPKYTVQDETRAWKPTPPAYMAGIEPHWNKIRPFVLDSAQQFIPAEPTPFDMDSTSQFYKELMEVYRLGAGFDEEKTEIASFWDCNPYVSHQKGHAMYATKKITPGGHWMGIAKIACQKEGSNFMQSLSTYVQTSVALADAFISCWDEKWRSVLVRPETLINEFIDPNWEPLLQTPPFPEHTSGHSVISRSAALILTDIYGDNFNFVDSTEVEYGLPTRKFNSFLDASDEAAISRLYGGIHYRPACELGVIQGDKVGKLVIQKLETKKANYSKN